MSWHRLMGVAVSLALLACEPQSEGAQRAASAANMETLRFNRLANGDLEFCNARGDCQRLPYDGDCAVLEVDIDPASGATCERCILDDGTIEDLGCGETSIGCVLVTLPEPDCLVCAYINGAVVYSDCLPCTDPGCFTECYTDKDCFDAEGSVGFCVEGQCVHEPGCYDVGDCPPGFVCQLPFSDWYGTCVPREIPCVESDECPPNMYCEAWCYNDAPAPLFCNGTMFCPAGYECLGGQCECVDCGAQPAPCIGTCEPTFANPCETLDCPAGQHCEVYDARCSAPPCLAAAVCVPDDLECSGLDDCPDGFVCDLSCPATCAPDEGCPPCYGVCVAVEPSYCFSDDDCVRGEEVCEFHQTSTEPCDPNNSGGCSGSVAQGVCVPARLPCESNGDCNDEAGSQGYCIEGSCRFQLDCDVDHAFCDMIVPSCPADRVISIIDGCYGPCIAPSACEPVYASCRNEEDCPLGHVCAMYCSACSGDTNCQEICEGVCVPRQYECRYNTDCIDSVGTDAYCIDGVCVGGELTCYGDQCPEGMECITACGNCDPDQSDCVPSPCVGICVESSSDACFSTGCSGEICADTAVATDCVWRAEYACLDVAVCGRQANGECAWISTPESDVCLEQFAP